MRRPSRGRRYPRTPARVHGPRRARVERLSRVVADAPRVLRNSPRPTVLRLPRRPAILGIALVALALTPAACGGGSSSEEEPTDSRTSRQEQAADLPILALGDSEATGSGDPTGAGWVGRYARLLRQDLGVKVRVSNLAEDGTTSEQLLDDVRSDPATRAALGKAQVVLLAIGGADLNAGDDALAAGECRAEACYTPVLKRFARNLDATVGAIRRVRGSRTTVLRAMTQPNALTGAEDLIPPFLKRISTRVGVYQAKTANRAICRVMAKYDGRCVDVLTRFNGPDGTENGYEKGLLNLEDCCYPSARGQQLMAEMLLKTGLAPLR